MLAMSEMLAYQSSAGEDSSLLGCYAMISDKYVFPDISKTRSFFSFIFKQSKSQGNIKEDLCLRKAYLCLNPVFKFFLFRIYALFPLHILFRIFLCLHIFLLFILLFYHVRRARITLAYSLGGSVFKSWPKDSPYRLVLPCFYHPSTKQVQ
jgi:hypothetical protein